MSDKEKALDPKVVDLSGKIDSTSSMELVDGAVNTVIDKSVYLDSLKANDLDPEVGRRFKEHDALFLAAAVQSFGSRAQDIHKLKGSPDRISVKIPTIARDKLSLVFDRTRTSRNPRTKETTEGYGVSAKWVVGAGGQYSQVKENLRRRALDLKIN